MNDLAAKVPVGSQGVTILPFGNGAERVLENRRIGCCINGINFNIHNRCHVIRAAQEGIVFSFMYGMEIMKGIGMDIKRIHAGKANMFLSPIFRDTLASVSEPPSTLSTPTGRPEPQKEQASEPEYMPTTTRPSVRLKCLR